MCHPTGDRGKTEESLCDVPAPKAKPESNNEEIPDNPNWRPFYKIIDLYIFPVKVMKDKGRGTVPELAVNTKAIPDSEWILLL